MSDEEPVMVKRMDSVHNLTVTDVVNWCLQRELDPDTVTISGGHLKWESPQTPEEKARTDEYHVKSMARHEEWERQTYERLRVKFDDTAPAAAD